MTRDQAKQLLPIIAAYAEGKTVQAKFRQDEKPNDNWDDQHSPEFGSTMLWRVKPEPREWWIGFCPIHGNRHAIFYSKPIRQCEACEAIHVREVTD